VNYFVQERRQRTFLAGAETAEAVIVEMKQTGGGNRYAAGFRFLLEVHPTNRPAYQARTEATIQLENIPHFQPGAIVPVKYNPKNPTQVMIL
jgi:hypothetical protein